MQELGLSGEPCGDLMQSHAQFHNISSRTSTCLPNLFFAVSEKKNWFLEKCCSLVAALIEFRAFIEKPARSEYAFIEPARGGYSSIAVKKARLWAALSLEPLLPRG